MLRPPPSSRASSRPRPRRDVRLLDDTTGCLEVRSLLTAAAVIQWSMAPRIAPDPAHGDAPDLPNTPAYVNPPDGYGVLLDASQSVRIQPSSMFSWTVTDSSGHSTTLSGEDPTVDLQQGSYTVALTATGLAGTDQPVTTTADIQVKDILIVSIGDSYASGEGDPVVPGADPPEWAYSPDPAMDAENADAHRSTLAAPAQFALELQEANPHEAVTFVLVADSGASIPHGVLGPMKSIGDPGEELPAQMSELRQILGTRHVDVLTVSVGGDDIGFAKLAEDLIANTYNGSPRRAEILAQFHGRLGHLPRHYAELARAIRALDPGQVLVTDYPDLTRNQDGKVAEFRGPLDLPLVSRRDARFASARIIPALDGAVEAAARKSDWTLVQGIDADFLTHGYPSTDPWIRTLGESLEMQGNADGTFHPNAAGQLDIAEHLLATYLGNLAKAGGTS